MLHAAVTSPTVDYERNIRAISGVNGFPAISDRRTLVDILPGIFAVE
jgi:hypothetical protein